MIDTFFYKANTIGTQVIDIFDPAEVRAVKYSITLSNTSIIQNTDVDVTHNGIQSFETATSFLDSGNVYLEFETVVNNFVGELISNITNADTMLVINKTTNECVDYGDSTKSGRIIKGNTGFGVSYNDNTAIVRQQDNNSFGYLTDWSTSNTYGPVVTESELFDADALQQFNDCDLVVDDVITITPTGQFRSSVYVEIDCVPNQIYRLQCNAYFLYNEVYHKDLLSRTSPALLTIGSDVASDNLARRQLTDTDSSYTIDVVPSTDKIYVGFGYGELGVSVFIDSVSFKKLVPFHTYNQDQGTFYVKWAAIVAGNDVITFGNNIIGVDGSNNITINSTVYSSQQPSNKIAFVFDETGIIASVNGSTPTSNVNTISANVSSVTVLSADEFSYEPYKQSNATLQTITNG